MSQLNLFPNEKRSKYSHTEKLIAELKQQLPGAFLPYRNSPYVFGQRNILFPDYGKSKN